MPFEYSTTLPIGIWPQLNPVLDVLVNFYLKLWGKKMNKDFFCMEIKLNVDLSCPK
jgi:hypothetical protein